jgi:regulator of protease activity HflC (stomatin/prohibitin superfamily)
VLAEIREEIGSVTRAFGVHVTDLNVVKLEPPELVNRQRVRNWGAEQEGVQAIIQGKTRAHEIRSREKARAEAQRDLILAIADGLERNKSRQFSEPLLLSLSGMLDTTLKNPLTRASMAKDTLETLEKLQKMLDKPA